MKKTIYGESYNKHYKPTLGIDADPSITRITFKQYKEWVLQNASKADARRLNLEYIDVIIDYVLSALQQPQVCDDSFDVGTLHIGRARTLKVEFDAAEVIIPENPVQDESSGNSSSDSNLASEAREDMMEGGGVIRTEEEEEEEAGDGIKKAKFVTTTENGATEFPERANSTTNTTIPVTRASLSDSDNIFISSLSLSHNMADCRNSTKSSQRPSSSLRRHSDASTSNNPAMEPGRNGGISSTLSSRQRDSKPHGLNELKEDCLQFCKKRELSRLLLDNIPREILKRMVIRWPVGEERLVSPAELNRERLMITVWDVSGDPLQENFTPFFFSHRCLFVSLYNLTRGLDSPCQSFACKNLRNLDDRIPTNAEVLENWLGYVNAFTQPLPSVPFHCKLQTPVLPPVIIAGSFADELKENPAAFHRFFTRDSFQSYNKHLVESAAPSALLISSLCEYMGDEMYAGHHLLRREIDHLARQMPFCQDSIPIHWLKFEHLIYELQDQGKIIILYDDLSRYVSEHCNITGVLQILPILSHFHDVGIISHFYRHPLLSNIIVTKPQWLVNALSSIVTSVPFKWVTPELQAAFARLGQEGIVSRENLLLSYRCGRMHQHYWNETLFILNCMDLVSCHASLHKTKSLYVPCLITQSAPGSISISIPSQDDNNNPAILHFSSGCATFPIATFNQLVVRSIRGCRYVPRLFYHTAHFRLNSTYHLILSKYQTYVSVEVQQHHEYRCRPCLEADPTPYPFSPQCAHIRHVMGELEFHATDNIATLIRISSELAPPCNDKPCLLFSDEVDSFDQICPRVLAFVRHHVEFLVSCWFPGLKVRLLAHREEEEDPVVLDRHWTHTVLRAGEAPQSIGVWFN